jgi:hypothetical protein
VATRSQKTAIGIRPASEEKRRLFRAQEFHRYDLSGDGVSGQPFTYYLQKPVRDVTEGTNWPSIEGYQGPASLTVPPVSKGSLARPREHYALVNDRPAEVSVLCIVRDAVGRLPGGVGTRPDVAQVLRDSQYIADNVSDAQLNQVVSGALDRMHSQPGSCVQYDAEQKLWVYIHRGHSAADFRSNSTGTSQEVPGGAERKAKVSFPLSFVFLLLQRLTTVLSLFPPPQVARTSRSRDVSTENGIPSATLVETRPPTLITPAGGDAENGIPSATLVETRPPTVITPADGDAGEVDILGTDSDEDMLKGIF